MSLGMEGDASAASRLRTSASCIPSSSSAQHDTKPAGNRSRAIAGCTCARDSVPCIDDHSSCDQSIKPFNHLILFGPPFQVSVVI